MSLIIHIETATEVCSVSLARDAKIISIKENLDGRAHSAMLAVYLDELFRENEITTTDLDAIAVSKGPGSYTGLRIGVSVAKGLCYGSQLPLIAIDTLESMYIGLINDLEIKKIRYTDNCLFAPMIDARRMEVYTCLFNAKGVVIKEISALVVEPDSFNRMLDDQPIYFFGSGADKLSGIINHENAHFIERFTASSRYMAKPAYQKLLNKQFQDLAYFEPLYLKDFVTTTPKKKFL